MFPDSQSHEQKILIKPSFRKFNDEDIDILVSLMKVLGYEHNRTSLMDNILAIRQSGGEVFIADVAGVVCGSVSAIIDVRLAEGVNGEIVSLVVFDCDRCRGIGRGLVQTAESWLKTRVDNIRVRSLISRQGSHTFYKNNGYTFCKTQKIFEKPMV